MRLQVLKRGMLCCVISVLAPVHAATLSNIYTLALQDSPSVGSAAAQVDAARARIQTADAALGSKLALSGQMKRGDEWIDWSDGKPNNRSKSRQYGLQYSHVVYRPALSAGVDQSRMALQASQYQYDSTVDELKQKVAQAFFDVLGLRAELDLIRRQKQAVDEQKMLAKRSFEVGTVSITDFREAEAKFATLVAQEQALQLDLLNREEYLKLLAGAEVAVDDYANAATSLPLLESQTLNDWRVMLESNSPSLLQAAKNIDVANMELKKAQAALYPNIDLSASIQRSASEQGATFIRKDKNWSSSYGLSMTIPLFDGESNYRIKENRALVEKAKQDFRQARLNGAAALEQAFYTSLSAISKYQGLADAEESARLAWQANKRAYEVGMRVNADVLEAQSKLYEVRRDRLKAWYDAWLSFIKLKCITGNASLQDFEQVDAVLRSKR